LGRKTKPVALRYQEIVSRTAEEGRPEMCKRKISHSFAVGYPKCLGRKVEEEDGMFS
jgi:hypothetical protein